MTSTEEQILKSASACFRFRVCLSESIEVKFCLREIKLVDISLCILIERFGKLTGGQKHIFIDLANLSREVTWVQITEENTENPVQGFLYSTVIIFFL